MKLNFCTLFDSNYLVTGYMMYKSLERHCPDFHLYIFAFDQLALETLLQMALPDVTVVSLADFEDEDLLCVKPTRNRAEYCWTCTASTIKYCIENYQLDQCIYVDADLFFYDDPNKLVQPMLEAAKHVLITPHNYARQYDKSATSGKYCVQFMYFDNTASSMKALNWWRDACIEWCCARTEDGKFGDQKYLDDWLERFDCVYKCSHLGAGVAPWNVRRFKLVALNGDYSIIDKQSKQKYELIFYHFHALRICSQTVMLSLPGYRTSKIWINNIYIPYIELFLCNFDKLHKFNPQIELMRNLPFPVKTKFTNLRLFIIEIPKHILYFFKHKRPWTTFRAYHIYSIKNGKVFKS